MRFLIPLLAFIAIFPLQDVLAAAQQNNPRTLRTEYFSIDIPAGWSMPAPLKEQPFGGVSAAFVKEGSDIAVTLNFLAADIPAAKFAENMASDMQKSGMKASKPVLESGLYRFNIDGKAKGVAWIGSSGGVCAATLVFGNDPYEAGQLLRAVKSGYKKLLPTSINK